MHLTTTMDRLLQDFRYAFRMLRQSPGFTFVALLTLALGIGANTAIFSILDQVLLRALPIAQPDGLVNIRATGVQRGHLWSDGDNSESFSYPAYQLLRDNSKSFSGMLARHPVGVNMAFTGEPERVSGELVSGNYFQVLGVGAALGRLFTPEDDGAPGSNPVVVLSHGFWTSKLASSTAVLNQRVLVNGQPMTVVGVAQPDFSGVQVGRLASFFIPMSMKPQVTPNLNGLDNPNYHWTHLMGRLAPGVTREQARSELQGLYRQVVEQQLAQGTTSSAAARERFLAKQVVLDPGGAGRAGIRRESREPLLVLMGMALLVLLIATSNLANLLITRGTARARQYTIRVAMGAKTWDLVRQSLVESWLLFTGGAALALLVAVWLGSALVSSISEQATTGISTEVNVRVLLFNFAVALVAGTLAGLAPAVRQHRFDLASALKSQGNATSAGGGAVRFRQAIIAGEVALTLLLLTGAALFARTLYNLRTVDLGMNPTQLVSFSIEPELNGYSPERTYAFVESLQQSLRALPGVQSATFAQIPAFTDSTSSSNFTFEGYTAGEEENTNLSQNYVGTDYFTAMSIPLLNGRQFTAADFTGTQKVAVLSESAVRRFFQGRDPVGSRIGRGSGNAVKLDTLVVGVVKDAKHATVRKDPDLYVYFPYKQDDKLGAGTLYARTSMPLEAIAPSLRQAVRRLDANLPVNDVITLEGQINQSLYAERLIRNLSLAFGAVAALLAAVGLYGLLAYTVVLRTRDIGIRLALGADRRAILLSVLRQGMALIGLGIVIGLPVVLLAGRAVRSVLFQVSAMDAVSTVGAVLLLLAIGLLASYIPALRATKVDPMVALRYE